MFKKILSSLGIVLLIAVGVFGVRTLMTRYGLKELMPTAQKKAVSVFNTKQYSTTDPTSIWVIVNKQKPLRPTSYAPTDLTVPTVPLRIPGNDSMQLRTIAANALEKMFAVAKTEGINLMLSSGYRSYQYQMSLYGGYVNNSSIAEADKTSARPGYSEHQTGLAADIEPLSQKCDVDVCFADTPEGKWLASNAFKYGFIIRYTKDKVPVTGYSYEPWHVRYIGLGLANELRKQKVETLEEFFKLGAAPNYSS